MSRRTVRWAVMAWGKALLAADTARVGDVSALGLDETLFGRRGRWRTQRWCTSITNVAGGQLLDIVAGREAEAPIRWLLGQPEEWRRGVAWGVPDLAGAELADDLTDADSPPEMRRLGRTLARWHTPIVNWHRARVTNGPTEAINNLTGRVKRAAFGSRPFAHYRIRALLYAGKPNWTLLAGVTPR